MEKHEIDLEVAKPESWRTYLRRIVAERLEDRRAKRRAPETYSKPVLDGLLKRGATAPLYNGTVSRKAVAKRRARNKMARHTRQAQRRAGANR